VLYAETNRENEITVRTLTFADSLPVFRHCLSGICHGDDEAAVRDALMKSALSFEKNDLAMASRVWANDESLTVFESGHANYGWADYRDHHLVPEMVR